MKKVVGIILLVCIGYNPLYAQPAIRDGWHVFNYEIWLTPCNPDGSLMGANPQIIEANTIFSVTAIVSTNYVIRISKFTNGSDTAKARNLRLVTSPTGTIILFRLSQTDYSLNAERLEKRGGFTVGAATTLIKIRPGKKQPKAGYNIT